MFHYIRQKFPSFFKPFDILALPIEMIELIFSFLPPKEAKAYKLVNRQFYEVTSRVLTGKNRLIITIPKVREIKSFFLFLKFRILYSAHRRLNFLLNDGNKTSI